MQDYGEIEIDHGLIERFGGRGPRYTSYPTADRFDARFTAERFAHALAARGAHSRAAARDGREPTPFGLYIHVPFCRTICYYCGCNKIGTKHQSRSAPYVDALKREIDLAVAAIGRRERISHLHFGGGTPTFLLDEEFAALFAHVDQAFDRAPDGEYSIEVDPRTVDPARLERLRALGLNRISLGIQDFDSDVQRAVNRVQSYEQTVRLIESARAQGFGSINVDLIYGLPRQSLRGFERTLELTIDAAPDRVALYQYAHLPNVFKPQRRIVEDELPDAPTRAGLFDLAVDMFRAAGYAYLGLDHFARANDELAVAQRAGRLHRNFQGYCSHDAGDILAFGVSAISSVGDVYAQNDKAIDGYLSRLEAGKLPTVRGVVLDDDDHIRRDAIQALMCGFRLDFDAFGQRHSIPTREYFAHEIRALAPMHEAGALRVDDAGIEVLPRGRLLVRAVAMAFDRHLRTAPSGASYSKLA